MSKIAELTTNYFETTTNLLFSITTELKKFKKISSTFYQAEKQIEQNIVELNNIPTKTTIEFSQYGTPFENNQQISSLNSNDVKEL